MSFTSTSDACFTPGLPRHAFWPQKWLLDLPNHTTTSAKQGHNFPLSLFPCFSKILLFQLPTTSLHIVANKIRTCQKEKTNKKQCLRPVIPNIHQHQPVSCFCRCLLCCSLSVWLLVFDVVIACLLLAADNAHYPITRTELL